MLPYVYKKNDITMVNCKIIYFTVYLIQCNPWQYLSESPIMHTPKSMLLPWYVHVQDDIYYGAYLKKTALIYPKKSKVRSPIQNPWKYLNNNSSCHVYHDKCPYTVKWYDLKMNSIIRFFISVCLCSYIVCLCIS